MKYNYDIRKVTRHGDETLIAFMLLDADGKPMLSTSTRAPVDATVQQITFAIAQRIQQIDAKTKVEQDGVPQEHKDLEGTSGSIDLGGT